MKEGITHRNCKKCPEKIDLASKGNSTNFMFISLTDILGQADPVSCIRRKIAITMCHGSDLYALAAPGQTSLLDWLPRCTLSAPPVMVLRTATQGVGENPPYA